MYIIIVFAVYKKYTKPCNAKEFGQKHKDYGLFGSINGRDLTFAEFVCKGKSALSSKNAVSAF